MRDPRPGIAWSGRRVAIRADYQDYMSGLAWARRRRAWRAAYVDEPVCQICAEPWTLTRGDLHHRSYRRLGRELDRDLIPLCRRCHSALHLLLESPQWLRLGRARATDSLVAVLRRQNGPQQ
jgi:5-methylcytosine-specific restriction endonuclease McrA